MIYNKEDNLELISKVRINKLARDLLKREKKKQNKSMAKLACEAIIKEYK